MRNLIVKTLEENRLFEDNYDEIISNNLNKFFENYKLNKSNNNPLPQNLKRDDNGFIILDNEPFIISNLKTDGHNENQWILFNNGSRALLKNIYYDEICMELLFQELANVLNIPCAKYDVVTLDGNPFLISQSFLSLDEYLFDYYNVEYKTFIDIETLIEDSKKIDQEKHVRKTIFIDLLTNHIDRFPHNFKVIIHNGNKKISPLYDNGLCCIGHKYKRSFVLLWYKDSIEPSDIIEFLISDKDFNDWVLKYINYINPTYFEDKIKQEKGIYIDDEMKELFTKNVKENQNLVKEILKK